jgi:alpha-tubulin suppressor-like RCC1 family protein
MIFPYSPPIWFKVPEVPPGTHDVVAVVNGASSPAIQLVIRDVQITGISPVRGEAGSEVTLSGNDFGDIQSGSYVTVNGITAEVQSWSDTDVRFIVPLSSTGTVQVYLYRDYLSSRWSNPVTFTVGARITGLTPGSGTGSDELNITGNGFGGAQGIGRVMLHGIEAPVVAWSNSQVVIQIPDTVTAGTSDLYITRGTDRTNAVAVSVTPKVLGLAPAAGAYDQTVAVTGTNFGSAVTWVTVGSSVQSIQSTAGNQVVFRISGAALPGAAALRLAVGGQGSNTVPFTVLPSVTALSPSAGTTGTVFRVDGHNFGHAAGYVDVAGASAVIESWNAAQIRFRVPADTVAGLTGVTVGAGNQVAAAGELVLKPTIGAVSPSGATAETMVRLLGGPFGAAQGTSALLFDGVPLTAMSWSPSEVSFRVPFTEPGRSTIALRVAGVMSDPADLRVLFSPRIVAVAPLAAIAGSVVRLAGSFDSAVTVANGTTHTCALTYYGGVKCWGANEFGQLGDGTLTSREIPGDVAGLNSGVTAISIGDYNTCALLESGGVTCWGANVNGELGDGTTDRRSVPVLVSGLSSGVNAVVSGYYHACALLFGGAVKCWGYNGNGELGDGTTTRSLTPVNVLGLNGGVTKVSAGALHSCAVVSGGLKCWGHNEYGQVGNGHAYTDQLTPDTVMGMAAGVSDVAMGANHTCASTAVGGAYCWGMNDSGQLGTGSMMYEYRPTPVAGLASGVMSLASGSYHTCARVSTAGPKCWGRNLEGEVGDGTTTGRWSPVFVSGLDGSVTALSAGGYNSCVLRNGMASCWGRNGSGELAIGNALPSKVPELTTIPGRVVIGTKRARVLAWSPSELTVEIPDLPPGIYPVSAQVWGVGSNELLLTIAPRVTHSEPSIGRAGDFFTVLGSNFGASQVTGVVTLDGEPCSVWQWAPNAVTATVPMTVGAGLRNLVIEVNGIRSSPVIYTVVP